MSSLPIFQALISSNSHSRAIHSLKSDSEYLSLPHQDIISHSFSSIAHFKVLTSTQSLNHDHKVINATFTTVLFTSVVHAEE